METECIFIGGVLHGQRQQVPRELHCYMAAVPKNWEYRPWSEPWRAFSAGDVISTQEYREKEYRVGVHRFRVFVFTELSESDALKEFEKLP